VKAEFFHADGQTYVMKLMVDFRNFENTPKKVPQIAKRQGLLRSEVRGFGSTKDVKINLDA
jgi:hypothetical protein